MNEDKNQGLHPLNTRNYIKIYEYRLDQLPSAAIRGNSKRHYHAEAERFKKEKAKMATEIRSHSKPESPLKESMIEFIFHFDDKDKSLGRDLDNMLGSAKPYIDALVSEGIIADDKWPIVASIHALGYDYRPGVYRTHMTVYFNKLN